MGTVIQSLGVLMSKRKVDLGFVTRTLVVMASELKIREEQFGIADPSMTTSVQTLLLELGVRAPYPPIADVA